MTTEESQLALRVYKWAKRKKMHPTTMMTLLEYGLGIPVERPLIPDVRFDCNMRDVDAHMSFRFDVRGVLQLSSLLGVPNVVITPNRDRVVGVEAIAILLRRLRYPITYYDMLSMFGRCREQLCRIFNYMVAFVYQQWGDVIYCNKQTVRSRIASYATAVSNKGSPL
ncbi:hypothetical protein B5M09_013020 [Aphanomyces astaci]|uniref:Uncharacterized protein n=1 Tax=Aphanomyces astaci TaxID=112090 RepID=A0A425CS31_APHAT|nr:hypothetical protein B5M09_013020 [Aphanomyces astaci]